MSLASKQDFTDVYVADRVVEGNDPLFQLFLQVSLFQVTSEVILGNEQSKRCFKEITKSINKSVSNNCSFQPDSSSCVIAP